MKKLSRKLTALLLVLMALLAAAPLLYYFVLQSNSDALWRIVSEKCLPSQSTMQTPGACLKVDIEQQYVLFEDAKGPYHDLLMPTYPITGLESPTLEENETPPFIAIAWSERGRLAQEAKFPIRDQYLSLAINPRSGRSQDHLHIHIACLHPAVHDALVRQATAVTFDWSELAEPIQGRRYVARRLASQAFTQVNPVEILNDYLRSKAIAVGSFGLGLVQLKDGDFVLLAAGRDLLSLDLGSIGGIQDFTCAVAKNPNQRSD